MDVWVVKEACLDRFYERFDVKPDNGWVIVDVGAGIGDFAIDIARRFSESLVFAFEPAPDSFALLQENVALNHLQNVRAFCCAVGAERGTTSLDVDVREAVMYRAAPGGDTDGPGQIRVPVISLDDVFSQCELRRCDLLKIDCEGGEYDILLHASPETLAKIRHISLEYHEGVTAFSHDHLVRELERHGFQVRIQPNPAHRHLGYLYASRNGMG